ATTLTGLGMLDLSAGEVERGRRTIGEAQAIYERTEDGPGLESIPLNLGAFELDRGDPERACALLARCAETARQRGTLYRIGTWALAELAEAAIRMGDPDRARESLALATPEFRRFSDERGLRYAAGLEARMRDGA